MKWRKGSRDPYKISSDGAGYSFCWDGNAKVTIGYPNVDNELLQVTSNEMLITIPKYKKIIHFCLTSLKTVSVCRDFGMLMRHLCLLLIFGTARTQNSWIPAPPKKYVPSLMGRHAGV